MVGVDVGLLVSNQIALLQTPVIEAIGEAMTDEKQFADPCLQVDLLDLILPCVIG